MTLVNFKSEIIFFSEITLGINLKDMLNFQMNLEIRQQLWSDLINSFQVKFLTSSSG